MAMFLCPACGGDDCRVKDARPSPHGPRRRRMCGSCAYRWTTYEVEERNINAPLADELLKRAEAALETAAIAIQELQDSLRRHQDAGTGSPGTQAAGEAERSPAGLYGAAEALLADTDPPSPQVREP